MRAACEGSAGGAEPMWGVRLWRREHEQEIQQVFADLCSTRAYQDRASPANLRRLGRYHWHPLLWGLMGPA